MKAAWPPLGVEHWKPHERLLRLGAPRLLHPIATPLLLQISSSLAMRTYKTALVDVYANALCGILFNTQTFRNDDIIIMYATWNLITK